MLSRSSSCEQRPLPVPFALGLAALLYLSGSRSRRRNIGALSGSFPSHPPFRDASSFAIIITQIGGKGKEEGGRRMNDLSQIPSLPPLRHRRGEMKYWGDSLPPPLPSEKKRERKDRGSEMSPPPSASPPPPPVLILGLSFQGRERERALPPLLCRRRRRPLKGR